MSVCEECVEIHAIHFALLRFESIEELANQKELNQT